eukprot:2683722-Prymnesium_polylepis.2
MDHTSEIELAHKDGRNNELLQVVTDILWCFNHGNSFNDAIGPLRAMYNAAQTHNPHWETIGLVWHEDFITNAQELEDDRLRKLLEDAMDTQSADQTSICPMAGKALKLKHATRYSFVHVRDRRFMPSLSILRDRL